MIEFILPALPLLVLLISLLFGRYPGLETAMRLAERIGSGARGIAAALNSSRPRPPAAHAAHGGQLLAFSIAGRAPPA